MGPLKVSHAATGPPPELLPAELDEADAESKGTDGKDDGDPCWPLSSPCLSTAMLLSVAACMA